MHELSIAQAILDRVAQEMRQRPAARARAVGVKIGEISGVACDALAFSFEALVKGTDWEPLELRIDRIPRRHRCPVCGSDFPTADFGAHCPRCGNAATVLLAGDEMDLVYIDTEDA